VPADALRATPWRRPSSVAPITGCAHRSDALGPSASGPVTLDQESAI